jgi:hypothetical protein
MESMNKRISDATARFPLSQEEILKIVWVLHGKVSPNSSHIFFTAGTRQTYKSSKIEDNVVWRTAPKIESLKPVFPRVIGDEVISMLLFCLVRRSRYVPKTRFARLGERTLGN